MSRTKKVLKTDITSERFQIVNESLGKLYACRAIADIICFEKEMPDSLDEQTVGNLKFFLWQMIGEVESLLDCAEMK